MAAARDARAAELHHLLWQAVPGNEADAARCARGCGCALPPAARLISRSIKPPGLRVPSVA